MQGLCIHTDDGHRTSFEQVCAVPLPKETRTYKPVANRDFIDLVRDSVTRIMRTPIKSESYGLSQKDQQMFGYFVLDQGAADTGLSIGFRNSYNKSLPAGLVMGMNVFVCDNLCFSGSDAHIIRKHTKNVHRELAQKIHGAMQGAEAAYRAQREDANAMKRVAVDRDMGYGLLGMALGHGLVKQQQLTPALDDWTAINDVLDWRRYDSGETSQLLPHIQRRMFDKDGTRRPDGYAPSFSKEPFVANNMWSLYNCVTEGLKKGAAGQRMQRQMDAHDWFRKLTSDMTN